MNKINIDFKKAGFADIISDYFSNAAHLSEFYEYPPILSSFKSAITAKAQHPVNRELLVEVLNTQYALLKNGHPAIHAQIQRLTEPATYTVTTGHQLNLFTGPLYFIYKIITTIKLSRDLCAAYPDHHFVPVYWMASEDHDIAEINHTSIFGKPIAWHTPQTGPAGRLLTNDMQTVLEELGTILGESPQAQELFGVIKKAYTGNSTLAAATRALVHELFGEYGLVIVDGDDARLKSCFAQVMYKDITQKHSYRLVTETATSLQQHYKIQVHPREINFFYIENGLRERIVEEHGIYKVLNTTITYTAESLKKAIDEHPEKFSPNVVTRPLYQESILPNLAYIGGPAEVAYWFEYKSMFRHYHIPYPVVMLRNCMLWMEENTAAKMEKLKLNVAELFGDTPVLLNNYARKHSETDSSLATETEQLASLFESVISKAALVDVTLKAPAEGEKQKQIAALQMMEGRMVKAQKKKQETTLSQVKAIKDKLFPNENLQERYDNFIPYYLKYNRQFFEMLLQQSDPFEQHFTVLQP